LLREKLLRRWRSAPPKPAVSEAAPAPLRGSRTERLLACIDPARGQGLELGALTTPVLTAELGAVEYADHLPTEGLRDKYHHDPNVAIDAIVNVTHVMGERPLPEVTGRARYHHVVASHVIEHAPDLIGWLGDIHAVLKPGGVLALAIPDKRYTFDAMRRTSGLDAMIDAHLRRLRKPSPQQAFDHFAHAVHADAARLWEADGSGVDCPRIHDDAHGLYAARQAQQTYLDCHCWVFTPTSFLASLSRLAELDLFHFEVINFEETHFGEHEFFASLRALHLEEGLDAPARQARVMAALGRLMPG